MSADAVREHPGPTADAWIAAALAAHDELHSLKVEYERAAARRRECVQAAIAAGATQQQVATALGIARAHVATNLVK